ncbi:MAG: conjugal transfer protein TrbE [Fusobacteriaceae bacterium]|nr:conjugal transfer protein TrbE [Fusobacteriaceae bacterium]
MVHLLPWAYILEDGIIINKTGAFQTTFSYRGSDLASCTMDELNNLSSRLNNTLKRVDERWTFHIEMRRFKSKSYMKKSYMKEIPVQIIEREREDFFKSGSHYESKYYITITYRTPEDKYKKLGSLFFTKSTEQEILSTFQENLKSYKDEITNIYYLLSECFKEITMLNTKEQLSYYHSCISDSDFEIEVPQYCFSLLDNYLADCDLIAGMEPMLGKNFFKTISILNFPNDSFEGILDKLNNTNIEFRLVTRFIPLEKFSALTELNKYYKKWYGKRKSFKDSIAEAVTQKETKSFNRNALANAEEVQQEQYKVEGDQISIGFYTLTAVIFDQDKKILEDNCSLIKNILNSIGFVSKIETFHNMEAFLGTIPGNVLCNDRRPPISSLSTAHLIPTSAVWSGREKNYHLNEPALVYTQTTGSTPFRINLHYGDVGHSLVFGPTGSGKSVLLNFLTAQFLGYKNAKVYTFDMGGSSRVLNYACNGKFYDLGENKTLSFQPLKNIHNELEKEWAAEFIATIIEEQNIILNPELKQLIWNTLGSLAAYDTGKRTMSLFRDLLFGQNKKLGETLNIFTGKGQLARYFDSDNENFEESSFTVFEMEKIVDNKAAISPALDYLFHMLENKLDGNPVLICLDEAWVFLNNPKFEDRIKKWLKTFRKKNASVIFATQSMSDARDSKILHGLLDNCYTRFYLPNANAAGEDQKDIYKLFGLNPTEINRIAYAIPKRQYYFKNPEGSRLFELALSNIELAYVATSTKEDQIKAKDIKNTIGSKEKFNAQWLNFKGFNGDNIIETVKNLTNEKTNERGGENNEKT